MDAVDSTLIPRQEIKYLHFHSCHESFDPELFCLLHLVFGIITRSQETYPCNMSVLYYCLY